MNENEVYEQVTKQVKDDLNKFSTRFSLSHLRSNRAINVKQVVYRSTTLFLCALGRICNCRSASCFDIVDYLADKNVITVNTKHKLMYAVALACEIRLRLYMNQKCQEDVLQLKSDEKSDKAWEFLRFVGPRSTVNYFQIAYCLQSEVAKTLRLTKLHFYSNLDLLNITICYSFGYENQVRLLLKSFKDGEKNNPSIVTDFDQCISFLEQNNPITQGDFNNETALAFSHMTETDVIETSRFFHSLGELLRQRGVIDEAIEYFQHSSEIVQNFAAEIAKSRLGDNHCIINEIEKQEATSLSSLSRCFFEMRQYSQNLEPSLRALEIYRRLSSSDVNTNDVAEALINVGTGYFSRHQFDDSLKYFQEALEACEKTTLNQNMEDSFAKIWNGIGMCLFGKHEYKKALLHHNKALAVQQKITLDEEMDPEIAKTFNLIGLCYLRTDHYRHALSNLKQALRIRENIFTEQHVQTASLIHNVGLCYSKIEEYDTAIKYLEKALHIFEQESLDKDKDFYIAFACASIGETLIGQKHFEKSLEFLKMSMEIRETISSNPLKDSDLADSYKFYGICLLKMDNFIDSLKYFDKSLSIYTKHRQNGSRKT